MITLPQSRLRNRQPMQRATKSVSACGWPARSTGSSNLLSTAPPMQRKSYPRLPDGSSRGRSNKNPAEQRCTHV